MSFEVGLGLLFPYSLNDIKLGVLDKLPYRNNQFSPQALGYSTYLGCKVYLPKHLLHISQSTSSFIIFNYRLYEYKNLSVSQIGLGIGRRFDFKKFIIQPYISCDYIKQDGYRDLYDLKYLPRMQIESIESVRNSSIYKLNFGLQIGYSFF